MSNRPCRLLPLIVTKLSKIANYNKFVLFGLSCMVAAWCRVLGGITRAK